MGRSLFGFGYPRFLPTLRKTILPKNSDAGSMPFRRRRRRGLINVHYSSMYRVVPPMRCVMASQIFDKSGAGISNFRGARVRIEASAAVR
jgi:hypothetical protein